MSYRTALDLLQVPATVHVLPLSVGIFTLCCALAAIYALATMRRK